MGMWLDRSFTADNPGWAKRRSGFLDCLIDNRLIYQRVSNVNLRLIGNDAR
jgi:hypothetical protein